MSVEKNHSSVFCVYLPWSSEHCEWNPLLMRNLMVSVTKRCISNQSSCALIRYQQRKAACCINSLYMFIYFLPLSINQLRAILYLLCQQLHACPCRRSKKNVEEPLFSLNEWSRYKNTAKSPLVSRFMSSVMSSHIAWTDGIFII